MRLGFIGEECPLAHADLDFNGMIVAEERGPVDRMRQRFNAQSDGFDDKISRGIHE